MIWASGYASVSVRCWPRAMAFISGLKVRDLPGVTINLNKGDRKLETQSPALFFMLFLELCAGAMHEGSACNGAAPFEENTIFLHAEGWRPRWRMDCPCVTRLAQLREAAWSSYKEKVRRVGELSTQTLIIRCLCVALVMVSRVVE